MVDNRGISPISASQFKNDNASANKMSQEKYGQGGEYFAQDMEEENENEQNQQQYQDRSAQLRASLDGLAMKNTASMLFMKALKERQEEENRKRKQKQQLQEENNEEILED